MSKLIVPGNSYDTAVYKLMPLGLLFILVRMDLLLETIFSSYQLYETTPLDRQSCCQKHPGVPICLLFAP